MGAARQLRPAGELRVGRRDDALAERFGEPAVASDDPRDHDRERVRGVERRAAVDARVEIALAGAEGDVEVEETARRDHEHRQVLPDHVDVEDHCRVRPTLVGSEEVDDRVAAHLLLAVAADPDVHRERRPARASSRAPESSV